MNTVHLTPPTAPVRATIPLIASKSESNRALIIDALTGFGCTLTNLATARDTQTLIRLLHDPGPTADVLDAGTTMRFLTAYFAVTGQQKRLTGTPRMCQRPIGLLVDSLRSLGSAVDYEQVDGFPPLQLRGFQYTGQNHITIRGDVSSQFISALLLVAPYLPEGLHLRLTGDIGSRPYIDMTIAQMRHFGASVLADWPGQTIRVEPGAYRPGPYAVESDWSGASYWFSTVALARPGSTLDVLGLKPDSLQGDSAIVGIMAQLGVATEFITDGVRLTQIAPARHLTQDFTDCPDLAQTVAVCCAMLGVAATFTGVESLKIKETNRILALQTELRKLGANLLEIIPNQTYHLIPVPNQSSVTNIPMTTDAQPPTPPRIATYDDHRMAMAFAPVALCRAVSIEDPSVVAKSYPSFWDDMARVCGVQLQ
jgi:3-phosphoshikimate 1-carboxyvinyltransferase